MDGRADYGGARPASSGVVGEAVEQSVDNRALLLLHFWFCHSERSERTCFLPFFGGVTQKVWGNPKARYFELAHNVCGNTGKEREKAGSLATLGMTTRKAKTTTRYL